VAYSFGRQFRRIAAQAITADRAEMDALIKRILPPREDGGARVLQLTSDADCERAPAAIVAAFFADAITGNVAAALLRQTEDPAFRQQAVARPRYDYALWGPVCLTPGWRPPTDRPRSAAAPATGTSHCDAANGTGELVNNNENTSAPCCDAENADGEEAYVWRPINPNQPRRNHWDAPDLIRCRVDTGTPADRDAEDAAPERPP
jgi:hypothetical protein